MQSSALLDTLMTPEQLVISENTAQTRRYETYEVLCCAWQVTLRCLDKPVTW